MAIRDHSKAPLKWAGGKRRVLDRILEVLPRGRRFLEPFVGSAVVFLNVDYPAYVIADNNPDLVRFYERLKAEGAAFIEECRAHFSPATNCQEHYYALRERFNATENWNERAAMLPYFNRHGYNGLYRVNSKGIFNVPFGRMKRPLFAEEAMLRFHEKAQQAEIRCGDFEQTLREASEADVAYCDPAYVPLSRTASFTAYAAGAFGMDDQRRLADAARAAADRGATVVISNHDTEVTREIYTGARLSRFEVRRSISRDGDNRGAAPELLAVFSPS